MHYLITGANGFVMSVLAARILDAEPDAQVTAIDLHDPDQAALDNLGPQAQRAHFRAVDVTDADAVAQAVREASPDAIVHGATVTHDARSEVENPARFKAASNSLPRRPASAVASSASASMPRSARMAPRSSTMASARAITPPQTPEPAPKGTTGTRSREA